MLNDKTNETVFPHSTAVKIVVARDTNATPKINFNTYHTHTLSFNNVWSKQQISSSSNTNSEIQHPIIISPRIM